MEFRRWLFRAREARNDMGPGSGWAMAGRGAAGRYLLSRAGATGPRYVIGANLLWHDAATWLTDAASPRQSEPPHARPPQAGPDRPPPRRLLQDRSEGAAGRQADVSNGRT